ncbi:hypothetical protein CFK37_19520 [Virgibacillus phasianinus]|uniref:Lipoprotein n=1 Tax=Virgibacillus phasianinus TaxID=2017483 RepID=A0A220U8I5_9BACI|nr:hypothetical protein [Virgibacillus phasianinus]ASK64181.1 hypothetical protein CFK37_19520 [Virgibacillus phasianinus]
MRKCTYKFLVTALFASILLMVVGCTEKTENQTQDAHIQTIEAVVHKTLTGPTDELKQVLKSDGLEDFVKYEEKRYKEYFANDTSYLHFVNNFSWSLMMEPIRNNYKLKVKNIEFEKTESDEIIYDFTVEVQYQKEGSDSSEVTFLDGEANMNAEHKVERILFRDKGFHKLFQK